MARITLQRQTDLAEEYRYLLSEDALGELNLLCAMANNPGVLQSYMRYGTTLWKESGVDPDDIERCILAVARALDAEYEWHQHVPIARDCGVTETEIRAIAQGSSEPFDDSRSALLAYVRAVALGDASEDTYIDVADHYDELTVVGVTLLATHYLSTARFLDALDVETETPFRGWVPETNDSWNIE